MASLGPATINVIMALTVVYIPSIASPGAQFDARHEQQLYVESARAIGVRDHIIPCGATSSNSRSP